MYLQRQRKMQERIKQETKRFFDSFDIKIKSYSNKCEQLISLTNKFCRQKIDIRFLEVLQSFNHSNDVQKTKSRLCGGLLKKGDRAYKCYNCMTEDNSIICLSCFEKQKHKGHQYQLIELFGGCCDCGDQQKWMKNGFCKQHSGDIQMSIQLNEQLLARFIQEQHVGFKILLLMYCSYLEEVKYIKQLDLKDPMFDEHDANYIKESAKKIIVGIFEKYSEGYFKQLIQFNSCGLYANSMTSVLFQSHLDLKDLPLVQSCFAQTNFFKLLFKFILFEKSADRVCDLCITLFQLNGFRQTVTIQFISNYINVNQFCSSFYSHLSSQLFTSYLAISKLVRQKKISPILVCPFVESDSDLNDSAQAFVKYYFDLIYISKLYGSASIEYFHYHAEKGAIVQIADYRRLYNQFPKAKDYYGLQQIFLNRILSVVKVMQRQPSQFIMKSSLRQLYKFISGFQNSKYNYYRPHERLFTLVSLAYLQGDINKLDEEQAILEYLAILGVNQLQKQLTSILQNICTVLSYAAHLLLLNQQNLTQNFTFYSYYFKKSDKLFNLDAILLKIIIKICQFHNRRSANKIDFSQIIKNSDKFNNIINKMQRYNSDYLINTELTTIQDNLPMGEEYLLHFVMYLSLLNEAIVSDLPLIAIKCFLQPTKEEVNKYNIPQISFKAELYHYYQNILKSCQNKNVSIKQFKTICQTFFKQEEIFKQFVSHHVSAFGDHKMDAQKSKGQKISLDYYKSISIRAKGFSSNENISYIPYRRAFDNISLLRQQFVILMKKSLQYLKHLQKHYQVTNNQNYKIILQNCYNELFNFAWTIFIQTHNQQLYQLIEQALSNEEIKHFLIKITKQIKNYKSKGINGINEIQAQPKQLALKKELLKQKLSKKKNLMNQKMNINKQLFIQNQPIQQETHQQSCCICKEVNEQEDTCFVAMMSETNYNTWAFISPETQIYSFVTCGHLIHKTCYSKIMKNNKVYSFCPLCKKPMNIIIPRNIKANTNKQKQFFEQYSKIVKIHHSATQHSRLCLLLFQSLVAFLVVRGLLFPNIFKRQLKIYQSIAHILLQLFKDKINSSFFYDEKHQLSNFKIDHNFDELFQEIFEYFSIKLFQCLSKKVINKRKPQFSDQFKDYVDKIILMSFGESNLSLIQQQFEQIERLRETIIEPNIQTNLSQLSSKHVGQCPNCSLITNQQAKCLICPNFITCINCKTMNLMAHTKLIHKGSASFIKTFTGEVVYIYRNRFWIFQSIYEDYIGRIYEAGNMKKADYKINLKRWGQFHDDIINASIQSRLRYKQKQSNKVNHNQQL